MPLVDSKVPIAVSRESQDRPFAAMVRGVKAVLQIAGSLSLGWQSTTQRNQPFIKGRLLGVQLHGQGDFNFLVSALQN